MATALPSFVTCDVCFEVFKELKSLICRHTFCSPCVDKIKRGNEVECPMCKRKSELKDIEPDFRTSELVEAFTAEKVNKNNNQSKTEDLVFTKTATFCEFCSSNDHPIICKCKECNKLMCKECRVSHEENTLFSNHTVKSIVSLAAENKTSLLKLQKRIEENEASHSRNKEILIKSLEDCNSTEKDISQLIDQKATVLIDAIKKHHDNLQRRVHEQHEMKRNACMKCLSKADYGLLDIQGKLHVISSLVDSTDDVTLASIAEEVIIYLYEELASSPEVPKEIHEKLKIEVSDGEAFDESKSTKLSISCPVEISAENPKVPLIKDFSMVAKYDFKLAKVVSVPEKHQVEYMFLTDSELYCITKKHIHIYSKHLELKKSTELELVTNTKAALPITGNYFVTACTKTGLHVHNKEGKHLQIISQGSFIGVFIKNGKIYAYDCETKKLTCYNQSPHHWEMVGSVQFVLEGISQLEKYTKLVPLDDKLYLSNFDKDCIYKCDFNGKLLNTFGSTSGNVTEIKKRQLASGKLYGPYVCCSDCSGNIIIADRHNHRLQLCTDSGEWSSISVYGEPNLTEPTCLAVNDDGQCIWLAEHESQLKMYKVTTTPKLELSEQ